MSNPTNNSYIVLYGDDPSKFPFTIKDRLGNRLSWIDDLGFPQGNLITAPYVPPSPTPNWINVKAYGAKGDAQKVTDGAGGVGYITSSTANFQASDVGKVIWAVTGDTSGTVLVQTTIASIVSSTRVNLASGGVGANTGLVVVWGTDDTAALQAASTAAVAMYHGGGGSTNAIQLTSNPPTIYCPAGGYIFQKLPFDFTKQGYAFAGPNFIGDGANATYFYPSANYDFTTTYANRGMMVSGGYGYQAIMSGWTLDGTNCARPSGAAYYYGAELNAKTISDVVVTGFNASGVGGGIICEATNVIGCTAAGNAVAGWIFEPGPTTVVGGLFSNSNPASAVVTGFSTPTINGSISFHGTTFDEPGLQVLNSLNVSLHGCTIYGGDPNGCLYVDGTSSVYIYGGTIGAFGTPTNATGLKIASGGLVAAYGAYIYGRGSSYALNNSGTFIDGGGNTIVNNTSSNVFTGSGTIESAFNNTTATSASAGSHGAVPNQVAGYLIATVNGTVVKIPYFST